MNKQKLNRISVEAIKKTSYFIVYEDFLTDEKNEWKELTQEMKLLYFKMCSRYQASILNKWIDEKGIPYIHFSIEEIMKYMNCANQKAQKMKKTLVDAGLLEEVQIGQGHPNRLYLFDYHIS